MTTAKPTRIDALIVGGTRASRATLASGLRRSDCEVRQAATIQAALADCRTSAPSVVFLDGMPVASAMTLFVSGMQDISRCRRVPVVLLASAVHGTRAQGVPPSGWLRLPRPSTEKELRRALLRVLPRRRGWQQRAPQGRRTRVLVIDDSALAREVLQRVLSLDPSLDVVGTARDAQHGWQKIQTLNPDVITLDIEMPGMDGLEFLERLMALRPLPVVMVSAHTQEGSESTLRALELGAVDFVSKPRLALRDSSHDLADELIRKVQGAALARRVELAPSPRVAIRELERRPADVAAPAKLIALGASTGGPNALTQVLSALPRGMPPIVITQHMPETFTGSFAKRLNDACRIDVAEASHGALLAPSTAWVAPGSAHLEVRAGRGGLVAHLHERAPINHHRPSVDVLFQSLVALRGVTTCAVLMTGMGADGARGLAALRARGATTYAQDEASCVVYGMPRAAQECGAAERMLPLGSIAAALVEFARRGADSPRSKARKRRGA